MNPGAHHLPRIPHTSLLPIILYCHPVFSRRLFLFLMFLFILIAISGFFPLNPSSILPVQCNAMGHSSFLLTFPCSSRFSLFFIHQLFVLSSGSLYSKKILYREKNTELLFFLYLHVTKISVHRCRNSETFLIGRFTAPGDCTCVNERVCVHECLFLSGRERVCLRAARIRAHI